ncbi:MAG TPA: hypothetical protein VFK80_10530 [Limnochordia bacterium]|nr:hypothetical protein [Limnochordia bacterium]
MRKLVAATLVCAMLGATPIPVLAADAPAPRALSLPAMLDQDELILNGNTTQDALISRLIRVETDVYGEAQTGPLIARVRNVTDYLNGAAGGGASLIMQLNAAEWMIFQRVSPAAPLAKRVDAIDAAVYGQTTQGPIAKRIAELTQLVWPTGKVNVAPASVPQGTLVQVKLLSALDSSKARVGDTFKYQVTQDVVQDNVVLIPSGATGTGTVTSVQQAGVLGQDGKIGVTWGTVPAMDGTPIPIRIDKLSAEKNQSLAVAAGASMAGVLLLGPIGLAAGAFIKGKDQVIASGTEFFTESAETVRVQGLSLVPNGN